MLNLVPARISFNNAKNEFVSRMHKSMFACSMHTCLMLVAVGASVWPPYPQPALAVIL